MQCAPPLRTLKFENDNGSLAFFLGELDLEWFIGTMKHEYLHLSSSYLSVFSFP